MHHTGCELPINRSGHVTREIRRTHKAGAKHQAALARRAEEHERAAEANLRRLEREWAEEARKSKNITCTPARRAPRLSRAARAVARIIFLSYFVSLTARATWQNE